MSDEAGREATPSLDRFVEGRADAPEEWRWLWEADLEFPLRSHRGGGLGRLVVAVKRWLRPLVRAPQADLWERQRVFNLVMVRALEHLAALQRQADEIYRDLQEVRADLLKDVQQHHRRLSHLEAFQREGLGDFTRHADGLFAHLDQKLDRYRRETAELAERLARSPGRDR